MTEPKTTQAPPLEGETEKTNPIAERRFRTFYISRDTLLSHYNAVRVFFSPMVVVSAIGFLGGGEIEYSVAHETFDSLPVGRLPPIYDIECVMDVTGDGPVVRIQFVEVSGDGGS